MTTTDDDSTADQGTQDATPNASRGRLRRAAMWMLGVHVALYFPVLIAIGSEEEPFTVAQVLGILVLIVMGFPWSISTPEGFLWGFWINLGVHAALWAVVLGVRHLRHLHLRRSRWSA